MILSHQKQKSLKSLAHQILARIWSNRNFNPVLRVQQSFSVKYDSVTPWTVEFLAPLSMGFSRQEYWSGLPCPSPGNLPDPGIEPTTHRESIFSGIFTYIILFAVYNCPLDRQFCVHL